jgi:hypothetical protein
MSTDKTKANQKKFSTTNNMHKEKINTDKNMNKKSGDVEEDIPDNPKNPNMRNKNSFPPGQKKR